MGCHDKSKVILALALNDSLFYNFFYTAVIAKERRLKVELRDGFSNKKMDEVFQPELQ